VIPAPRSVVTNAVKQNTVIFSPKASTLAEQFSPARAGYSPEIYPASL